MASGGQLIQVGPFELREGSRSGPHDIVAIGRDVVIPEGETYREAIVILGDLTVDGTLQRELVCILGEVKLGRDAQVHGEMVIVGGPLEAAPGSVMGEFDGPRLTLPPWLFEGTRDWARSGLMLGRPLSHHFGLGWWLAGSFLLIYLMLVLFFPVPMNACVTAVGQRPATSFVAGLLTLVLIGPLIALLAASVIGIVLIPLLASAFLVALLLGKAAVYRYAGEQLAIQSGLRFLRNPVLALIVGTGLFCVLYLVPLLGFLVWGLAATTALGCAVLASIDSFRRENPSEAKAPQAEAIPVTTGTDAPPSLPQTQQGVAAGTTLMPRAGFWIRLGATALDVVLIGTLAALFRTYRMETGNVFLSLWLLYHLAMWSWRGTTIGGLILGLRIVRTNGQSVHFSVALVRLLSAIFSALVLFLGFLWAGWNREKRSWHDLIADTVIVRVPKGHRHM